MNLRVHAVAPQRWLRVGALVLLAHGGVLWLVQSWDSAQPAALLSGEPILAEVLLDEPTPSRAAPATAPRSATPTRPTPTPAHTDPHAPPATAASETHTVPPSVPTDAASAIASSTPARATGAFASAVGNDTNRSRTSEAALVLPSADAAYLHNPPPVYPRMSRRLGEQGTVVLRVLISTQGQPERVELHRSSGFARLDQSALEAVPRWRFVPGQRQGVPEAMWFNVPVRFVLE